MAADPVEHARVWLSYYLFPGWSWFFESSFGAGSMLSGLCLPLWLGKWLLEN